MIFPNKFNGYNKDGTRLLFMGGGGGGGTTQTTSTVQNTNIPDYAKPYVESMLGATQNQLFNTSQVQTGTDAEGKPIMGTSLDSFKPYQAYGSGTVGANSQYLNQINPKTGQNYQIGESYYDPSAAVAGFSPMQQAAQQGIGNMQFDPTRYNMAQLGAEAAGRGGLSSAQTALNYGTQGSAAGIKGQELGIAGGTQAMANADLYGTRGYTAGLQGQTAGLQGQTLGILGGQAAISNAGRLGNIGLAAGQQGQNLGIAGGAQYGGIGAGYGSDAAGLANVATGYGDTGAGYGAQAAQLANTALDYGQGAADIGQKALLAQQTGQGITAQSQALANQQAGAGQQFMQNATDPNAIKALMNPYTQNVLDVQNKEMQRQADIARTQRSSQAVRAGAFGGSRQAIENAEAQRNLDTMKNANTAQALQQAYQQAQAQQQFGANLGLQGQSAAQQGLGTALQGGQLGLSGLGTALQGQQGALAGVGQAGAMYGLGMQGTQSGLSGVNAANQAYQTGIQGAGMGLQGVNAQLAGTAQGMQGAQTGLSGVDRQLAGTQAQLAGTAQGMQGAGLAMQGAGMGLQGVQTGLQGTQAQLAGTAQGMQGAQAGLQGVQGAQSGYGLTNQAAGNLTNILGQTQQNQLGLYGAQNTTGAQQQALEQAKINQSMLDYANAQQYPLMQLGTMSNMLRGLPMQASTTNQYAASPNPLSQVIGAGGAAASMYNATKPGGAAGGLPSEFKYAKGGGIKSYDMGGEVESQLESMDEKGLQAQARESSSPSIRKMAQRMLRERQMSKPQGADAANVQYQAQMPAMRGGGIIAFKTGGGANEEGGEDEAMIGMQERLAQSAPTTGGIMGATTQPTTQVPFAPTAGRAMQQAPNIPDFMKAEYADTEKRMNAPLSSFMAERQAAMREAGVADAAAGQQEQRAGLMAEKANMADEKERQKYMRLAEFFASWGSTPGPVLVAGLNAMQKTIPNIISDEKEQKKARREIDKSIADLDNATRLEKRGEVDAAMALKLKASDDMKALNTKFIDYQSRRESDISSAAASKYTADMHFRSEQLRAEASRLDRAARRETDDDNKRFNMYNTAANNEQRLISKISDQQKMFAKEYDTIKTAEMNAAANDGKMIPALVPDYEKAKARIAAQEVVWDKQKEQAARDTNLAYERVRINPQVAKDYTKSNAAPAAPAAAPSEGPVSGEFSAPTQAHIAALRSNPTQAAAFDAKFGPGAANEYLGK
jgi:hypothetical protein